MGWLNSATDSTDMNPSKPGSSGGQRSPLPSTRSGFHRIGPGLAPEKQQQKICLIGLVLHF